MRHLSTALLALALAGCSSFSAPSVDPKVQTSQTAQREVGQAFDIKIGEKVSVGELELTLQKVTSDSRCPIDVVCVWSGDAEVAVKLEQGSHAAFASLHTSVDPKKTEWNGYTISLVSLAPSKRSTEEIDPADYRARLLVSR